MQDQRTPRQKSFPAVKLHAAWLRCLKSETERITEMPDRSSILAATAAFALALSAPAMVLAKAHNNGINGGGNASIGGETAGKGGNVISGLVRSDKSKEKTAENLGTDE
ncbi:hypothetical protein HMH01_12880 [Halovulum dunhuangense]|uniref:Uncharacterized protein n=1 Tax=Halovulum dunhuangense TaxID=1505036 RepID=A0A849L4Z6_9RHOB|nr:hypothetical protein [Halovulum dunhuangense]NNU81333.1 hypothetical protein [Halovulum dunhuangense]